METKVPDADFSDTIQALLQRYTPERQLAIVNGLIEKRGLGAALSSMAELANHPAQGAIADLLTRQNCLTHVDRIRFCNFANTFKVLHGVDIYAGNAASFDEQVIEFFAQHGIPLFRRIECFRYAGGDDVHERTAEWETGFEHHSRIHYITFFSLFAADIDGHKLESIEHLLGAYPADQFAIYETLKGYHVFCVSRKIPHRSIQALLLHERIGTEHLYSMFSYFEGYRLRTSKKEAFPLDVVCRFVKFFGPGPADAACLELLARRQVEIEKHWPA